MAKDVDRILALMDETTVAPFWNLSTAIGDTVKDKAEHFYFALAEYDDTFYKMSVNLGLSPANRIHSNIIIAGSYASALLESIVSDGGESGYVSGTPTSIALGAKVDYFGRVKRRWQAFRYMELPPHMVLLTRWTKEEGLCKQAIKISAVY